tara:strand:- start:272 stop:649 length:378 start_codon:yes stop_codon:yes gene_type:complete
MTGRDSIFGLELAFDKIKEKCVEEVLRVKETNEELAKYVEVFSNSILTAMIDLKTNENGFAEKVETQVEVLDDMISDAASKREALLLEIKNEMEKAKEENISPTARMARAALEQKGTKKKKDQKK